MQNPSQDDERQPLLVGDTVQPSQTISDVDSAASLHDERRRTLFLTVICGTAVIGGMRLFLEIAPQTKIFQDIVCREYYKHADFDSFGDTTIQDMLGMDFDCKIEPVQSQVAYIIGWKDTLNELPSMIFALPFGILADRIGRRPVLLLSTFGVVLQALLIRLICLWPDQLPLRLVWATSTTLIIGGGEWVGMSMAFTMIADVFSAESRSKMIFRLLSVSMLTALIGPSISAIMMEKWGAWSSFWLSLILGWISFIMTFALPETLKDFGKEAPIAAPVDDPACPTKTTLIDSLHGFGRTFAVSSKSVRANSSVLILLLGLTVLSFVKQSQLLLLLYAARRLDWSIAQASFLLSMKAFIMLFLTIAIIPSLNYVFVRRLGLPAVNLDLYVAQASVFLITAGSFVIGFSNNLPLLILGIIVVSLGGAAEFSGRSFAASLIAPSEIGTVYTGLTVLESVARCIGSPVFAATFKSGMQLGMWWQGLPFLVAGSVALIALIIVALIRPPEQVTPLVDDGAGTEST